MFKVLVAIAGSTAMVCAPVSSDGEEADDYD